MATGPLQLLLPHCKSSPVVQGHCMQVLCWTIQHSVDPHHAEWVELLCSEQTNLSSVLVLLKMQGCPS